MELQEKLEEVLSSLDAGTLDETKLLLASLRSSEIAHLLESSPLKVRRILWRLMDPDRENQALQHLSEDVRQEFLESMNTAQLVAAADTLDTDDFADILQQLPETLTQRILASLDTSNRERLEAVLSFPEDTAGGLMDTDSITVHPRHAVEVVLRYLRFLKELPAGTDALFVINRSGKYVGLLPLAKLLTADPSVTVREIMDTNIEAIPVLTKDTDIAQLFSEQDLISAPVVDDEGRLLGRITVDDVVDVIIEDADEAVLGPAGLETDEDIFASIGKSFKRRAIWLTINLFTAFLAAAVINIFEDTIEKVVALAVLMPIVASMGGIAGTQTLTLVIRGLALGQIGRANILLLMNREFLIAVLNGLLLAAIVSAVTALAFNDLLLGGIIALAMIINLAAAALAGSILPPTLTRLGIDPAIAGGVVLTTITDVVGFFTFLGLATWAYA